MLELKLQYLHHTKLKLQCTQNFLFVFKCAGNLWNLSFYFLPSVSNSRDSPSLFVMWTKQEVRGNLYTVRGINLLDSCHQSTTKERCCIPILVPYKNKNILPPCNASHSKECKAKIVGELTCIWSHNQINVTPEAYLMYFIQSVLRST